MPDLSVQLRNCTGKDEFDLSAGNLIVPDDLIPQKLDELLLHMLGQECEAGQKFQFFIQGTLLCGSLSEAITELGLARENQVILEFRLNTKLPDEHTEQLCPDWIRCIKTDGAYVLSGSFDSVVRRHNTTGIVKEYLGHKACVTALQWINQTSFVSASNDWTLRWWDTVTGQTEAVFKGHEAPVQSLLAQKDLLISGDHNGKLAFWKANPIAAVHPQTDTKPKKKKQKGAEEDRELTCRPISVVKDHKECPVSAIKGTGETIFTSGIDKCVNLWDLAMLKKKQMFEAGIQVCAMDLSAPSGMLVLASPDGSVKLVDSRQMKTVSGRSKLHDGWISEVTWSPSDPNQFCSASADLSLCVWDIRGLRPGNPLKLLTGPSQAGKKILGLDWSASGSIYYGGEDCKLHRIT